MHATPFIIYSQNQVDILKQTISRVSSPLDLVCVCVTVSSPLDLVCVCVKASSPLDLVCVCVTVSSPLEASRPYESCKILKAHTLDGKQRHTVAQWSLVSLQCLYLKAHTLDGKQRHTRSHCATVQIARHYIWKSLKVSSPKLKSARHQSATVPNLVASEKNCSADSQVCVSTYRHTKSHRATVQGGRDTPIRW